jgi:hypothetical protein
MRILKIRLIQLVVSSLILASGFIVFSNTLAYATSLASDSTVRVAQEGGGGQASTGGEGEGGSSGVPVREKGSKDKVYSEIINPAIAVLSGGVMLAILGSIVIAGIQYSTANGNSSAVASAKNRIFISCIVLILYIFGFALLQWLIPGGIGS